MFISFLLKPSKLTRTYDYTIFKFFGPTFREVIWSYNVGAHVKSRHGNEFTAEDHSIEPTGVEA